MVVRIFFFITVDFLFTLEEINESLEMLGDNNEISNLVGLFGWFFLVSPLHGVFSALSFLAFSDLIHKFNGYFLRYYR